MIDHVSVVVSDFGRGRAFYDAALAPLGLRRLMEVGEVGCGYGAGHPGFWIGAAPAGAPAQATPVGVHIAFAAVDRAAVDAFYRAAMAAGGTCNGGPGLRPHYHPDYYAAFVCDPDGNRLEAVCHRPGTN